MTIGTFDCCYLLGFAGDVAITGKPTPKYTHFSFLNKKGSPKTAFQVDIF